METLATVAVSNSKRLCIGGVTRREANEAKAAGLDVDPAGIYLFLASDSDPKSPIEVLAKFFTVDQAERAAALLPSLS
jgi:hypothetical protein